MKNKPIQQAIKMNKKPDYQALERQNNACFNVLQTK